MPRFQFENKVTLSGLIQIALLIFAILGTYFNVVQKVDASAAAIVSLQGVDVEIKAQAELLKEAFTDERLETGKTLAEMRTDLRYIRGYVEDEKRSARP